MKKLSLPVFVTFLVVSIAFMSCSSTDKNAPLIPKDAAIAIHLNTHSLSSKLSWDEIRKSNWFQRFSNRHSDSLTSKILDDPDNSGMNSKEGFSIFMKRAGSRNGYAGFTGRIKDQSAFEVLAKKISQSDKIISQDGLKSIRFQSNGIVSWNENKFLYLVEIPFNDFGSRLQQDSSSAYQEPAELDLLGISGNIFHYGKDSLLIGDDRFSSLMKENGDVLFWANAETAYGSGSELGILSLLKMDVYFRESVTAASINFDNGKISMHAKNYSNKEMQELLRKYSGEKLNANLIQRIPSDSVIGVLAANFKPEGLKELLKLGGLDGMVNGFLGKYELSMDDLTAATKGDLLIAVTSVGVKRKMVSLGKGMDSLPVNSSTAEAIFATGVRNRAAFDKLIAAGKRVTEGQAIPGVYYNLNNELFVAGTSQALIDAYLRGGNHQYPFLSRISNHPVGFYLDLNKLITGFNLQVKDSSARVAYDASVQMWKDIVVTGGEFKNDAMVQEAEITLMDPNTNSLKQLNSYADKFSASEKRGF